jgi:RNA polymerase sigma factor (TIGR02999 family)
MAVPGFGEMPEQAPRQDLTDLLNDNVATGPGRFAEAFREHYDEIRRLAAGVMRAESRDHTLQPTALAHEAFLRLVDQSRIADRGTYYFRACIAKECRRILVEHVRRRRAAIRGGKLAKHPLDDQDSRLAVQGDVELLALHDLVEELYARNESVARVVDLRVFGGLTIPETAEVMGVSPRTVNKYWAFAQTWLKKELS